jgi:hypothetical protein
MAMKISGPESRREYPVKRMACDFAVAGGGVPGLCCALTAARAGAKVVLVQDRPVLGGNASSEVRMCINGAAWVANNRWAREGGVLDEILVENRWRNPEGNPVILDSILLEKAVEEKNLTLVLNAAVNEVAKSGPDTIASIAAISSQNETGYEVAAPLFCDATGDGTVGFLAGAAFRMGAEKPDEFGEKRAPAPEYGELLGHSIYFESRDTGKPVKYVPPSFALKDFAARVPRHGELRGTKHGRRLWWFEYGGRLDTVRDTEEIKWELWRIVYGAWDYIKNSGKHPEAANYALDWVGLVPGKRESRRFEGPYILRQQDIVEQRTHEDAVSYGGWSIDLHPGDGIYSALPGSSHLHARAIYQVPYRCLFSRNIDNLFLAGRVMSASHVAFGSIRVIGTLAHAAQAAGMAAAICARRKLKPAALSSGEPLKELRRELVRKGQFIPGYALEDQEDLARRALAAATSSMPLGELTPDGPWQKLDAPLAQMLPLGPGRVPAVTFTVRAAKDTTLKFELLTGRKPGDHTPDVAIAIAETEMKAGEGKATARFDAVVDRPCFAHYSVAANPDAEVRLHEERVTGLMAVRKHGRQEGFREQGGEDLDMWGPLWPARSAGIVVEPALAPFGPGSAVNGFARPADGPNAWVPDPADRAPALSLEWDGPVEVARVELAFDTDHDDVLPSVAIHREELAFPACVEDYRLKDGSGKVLAEVRGNHQTRNTVTFAPVRTSRLIFEPLKTRGGCPPALFEVRCYGR